MKYFGKVFVEFWDGNCWGLSTIPWYKYLLGRLCGGIGSAGSDKDYKHVPRSNIRFEKVVHFKKVKDQSSPFKFLLYFNTLKY